MEKLVKCFFIDLEDKECQEYKKLMLDFLWKSFFRCFPAVFLLLIVLVFFPQKIKAQAREAIVVYGANTNPGTPQYRIWDGTNWSAPANALSVGTTNINWVVVDACPTRHEYIAATIDANRRVNVQVFRNGSWGNLLYITNVPNADYRGVDVVYESISGDAIVVVADGDADPTYYIWNGSSWTGPYTLNFSRTTAVNWIKLAASPVSDEIIVMAQHSDRYYSAQVWNGSAWGNEVLPTALSPGVGYEAMALCYETSGNQAVIVSADGTAGNFRWRSWNGTTWSAEATQAIGDDFLFGTLVNDPNSDSMLLSYIDIDADIGKCFWNGSAWTAYYELETFGGETASRCFQGLFESVSNHSGHAIVCYSDTTASRSRHSTAPSGSTWDAEVSVSTIGRSAVVQTRRTGDGKILALFLNRGSLRYDFSWYDGTNWATAQTLESASSVRASPYKEPFMMAAKKVHVLCQTLPATNIENTYATLQGRVIRDNGVPCQYRFLYGTTTNLTNSTVWLGTVTNGQIFSTVLSGLQTSTVYYYCAQISNSLDVASGTTTSFRTGPPFTGWKSPDGHIDPSNMWANETNAYDTNTTTYASDNSGVIGWGYPIIFTLNEPIRSDRVRVFSDFASGVDRVRIEIQLHPSGVWSNVFEGSVENQHWTQIIFATTNISAARYTFRYTAAYIFWLYEFQFYVLPPVINVPSCETRDATSVEETSAIPHGFVLNDGGQPCETRFEYGLTPIYSTNTTWAESLVTGEEFTRLLLNLQTNTTYHFRAQVKNSAGVGSGSNMIFVTGEPQSGWVSPIGYTNSGTWTNIWYVMDDNTNTSARCYHNIGDPVWSPYLYLTHSTMTCDKVRFYARDTAEIDMAEVGVFLNGIWTNVYSNSFPDKTWVEASFPRGTVTQARVRFRLTSTSYGMDYEIYEFDFYRVVGVTLAGTYNQTKPVTLAVNGIVIGTFTNFSTNVFSFQTSLSIGSRILIYYDDDNIPTNSGALITRATGQNMLDLNLETDRLILRNDYGSGLTLEDMILAHSGDLDVPYRYSGTNIWVTNRITTVVASNHTFIPGTNCLWLRHNLEVNGTFNGVNGNTVFEGNSIILGSGSILFNNIVVSGTLTAPTGQMSIAGNFVNNGVFNHNNGLINFSGNSAISGSGTHSFRNILISGTLTAPPTTLNLHGNWTNNGTFNHNNGTIVVAGTSTIAGSSQTIFNNLILSNNAVLHSPGAGSYSLAVQGNWQNMGGTFNHNSGTFEFIGTGISSNLGSTAFYEFKSMVPGKEIRFGALSTQIIHGAFSVGGNAASMIRLRSTTSGSKWTIALPCGDQLVSYVDVQDSNATNAVITVAGGVNSGNNNTNWVFQQNRYWVGGSGNWNDTSHWAVTSNGAGGASVPNAGQLAYITANSGSGVITCNVPATVAGLIIEPGASITINLFTNTFVAKSYGLDQKAGTILGSNGSFICEGTFQKVAGSFVLGSGSLILSNNFTHSGGIFDAATGSTFIAGNVVMNNSSALRFGRFTINTNAQFTAPSYLVLTSNLNNYGTFNHNGGTINFAGTSLIHASSSILLNNVLISGLLIAPTNQLAIEGTWENNGSFNHNGGTILFAGNTPIFGTQTSIFNNVIISGSLTAPNTFPLVINGNFINNGTFNHNNGAVRFIGTNQISGSGTLQFNHLTINGSFTAPASPMYIAGNLILTSPFNPNNGTIIFNGSSTLSGTNRWLFDNITIWGTLTFPINSTIMIRRDLDNSGTLNLNGNTVVFCGTSYVKGSSITDFKDVIISNGTLYGCSHIMRVSGNWDAASYNATFYHNNGEVKLNGTSQQIIYTGGAWNGGTNNWKNNWYKLTVENSSTNGVVFADGFKASYFTCITPSARLFFKVQDNVTNVFEIAAANGLKLQGATNQNILLRKYGGVVGDQWEICPTPPWTVSYVDVMDSINSYSNPILPSSSVDSGNNINWFLATAVKMKILKAIGLFGKVKVVWQTASEINNAGFHIWRATSSTGEFIRITQNIIAGQGTSTKGASYSFIDTDVEDGRIYYYKLEAIETTKRSEIYGPVIARPGLDSDNDGMTDDWELFYGLNPYLNDANEDKDGDGKTNLQEFLEGSDPAEIPESLVPPLPWQPFGSELENTFKLYIGSAGVYKITASLLENAGATNLAYWNTSNIHIHCLGQKVPVYIYDQTGIGFSSNDYLLFYAEELNNRFTGTNIYWLTLSTNLTTPIQNASQPSLAEPTSSIFCESVFEKNELYWDELPENNNDDIDHWFFADYLYAPNTPPVSVNLEPYIDNVAATNADAKIKIALRGVNKITAHHIQLTLNGTSLPDGYWEGNTAYVYEAVINQTNLLEGTNFISITLPGDVSPYIEHVLIDWVKISYWKNLIADNNVIIFRPAAEHNQTKQFTIKSFTTNNALIFRKDSLTNVFILTNKVVGGSNPYNVTFCDNVSTGAQYCVISPTFAPLPPQIYKANFATHLLESTNQADYIIVCADLLKNTAKPLADYRQSQGLNTKVVSVEEIYDTFNYGIPSPYAIKDFLIYIRNFWTKPSPYYLLLIGDATYDYRNFENMGSDLLPQVPAKLLKDVENVEAPSDLWYVLLEGDDLVPEMYVGRISVKTTNELAKVIERIIDYEAQPHTNTWCGKVISIVDDGEEFSLIANSAKEKISDAYSIEDITLTNYSSAGECRNALSNSLNAGAFLTLYVGHGGIAQWADEHLFDRADIQFLTNQPKMPFIITPTCNGGYFINPPAHNDEALAEEFLRKTNNSGGAIAYFAPSALSIPSEQKIMVDGLFEGLFRYNPDTIGKAVTYAQLYTIRELKANSSNIVQSFMLFGDPALRIKKYSNATNLPAIPVVLASLPAEGSQYVSPTTRIEIIFNQPMDAIQTKNAFSISPAVAGQATISSNILSFIPSVPLLTQSWYTVVIASNACNWAGAKLTTNYVLTFKTGKGSSVDSDYDGLPDDAEQGIYFTDPYDPDTDKDYLTDGEEVLLLGTSPLSKDTDGDLYSDACEVDEGTDPLNASLRPTGLLTISPSLTNAKWELCVYPRYYLGATNGTGLLSKAAAPTGVYCVVYFPMQGYTTPSPQTQIVQKIVSSYYAKPTYGITVLPSNEVVFYGKYWLLPIINEGNHTQLTVFIESLPTQSTFNLSATGEATPFVWQLLVSPTAGIAYIEDRGNYQKITYAPQVRRGVDKFTIQLSDAVGASTNFYVDILIKDMVYPTFAVNEPAQNAILRLGKPIIIAWDGRYPLELARIELRRNNMPTMILADTISAASSNMNYVALLPFGLAPGKNYKIRVASLIDTNDWNESASFTLLMPPDLDYDGDSRSDLALYSSVEHSFAIMLASNLAVYTATISPLDGYALYGDIDGDSKTDPIIYTTTKIYAALSANNYTTVSAQLNMSSDAIPTVADYDGDSKADLALYLTEENRWLAFLSRQNYKAFYHNFGYPEALPIPADYDGDSKADPAIFIPQIHLLAAQFSSRNYALQTITLPIAQTDFLVSADYDADGKSDPAFYRQTDGRWFAALSSLNYSIHYLDMPFGLAMLPAPADYDGDGKVDPTIYDIKNAMWFIRLSSKGYALYSIGFGTSQAMPVYQGNNRN